MRISAFSVGEFATLRNVSGTLAPRLSVVWGGNESGKTTLSHFFRCLLFAEAHKGNMTSQGEGALFLLMDDGRNLKIELSGRESFAEDANGPITATPSISPHIWPASRLTELGAFSNLMNRLNELELSLYTPSDPESLLNRLWTDIKNNDLQVENLKDWKGPYHKLHQALEEKRESVRNASSALEKNRSALARLELIARARPAWLEVRGLEDELTCLGPPRDMPKRGIERLYSLQERIAYLRRNLNERRRKNAYEASRRRQMENNPVMTLLKYREPLEELEREMERFTRTETETAAFCAGIADAEDSFKKELLEIAPHWSENDLASANLSLAIERKARSLCKTIESLKDRIRKLLEEKTEEESKFANLQAEVADKSTDTKSLTSTLNFTHNITSADYRIRREVLLDIRREMLRCDALRWEIRGGKMCIRFIENEIKVEGPPPVSQGNYIVKSFLALLLSLAGVSVAINVLPHVFLPHDAFVVLLCVLIILGAFFSIFMARKEYSVKLGQWKARYNRRNGELNVINEKIVEHKREIQLINASIEHKSQILGIKTPSTLFDLDEPAKLLENEHSGTANLELKKGEQEQLLENLRKCETRLSNLKDKLSVITRELDGTLENWKNWLLQNRFDPELSPEGFDPFLAGARAASATLKDLDAMRRKLAYHREYEASIDARISELSTQIGLELRRDGLPAVFRSLKEALNLQIRIEAFLEDRRVTDFECSELERELAAVVASVRTLCEEAGVDSEEALHTAYEEHTLRLALEARLTESKRALASILAYVDKDASDVRDFLADALALSKEAEALKLAIADGEKTLSELRNICYTLEAQMNSMVSDNRLFTLRQRNETLKPLAQKGFHRWLAVILMKHFAEKAIERREKKLEPGILARAQEFLSIMAASNWKIISDEKCGERHKFCVALEREADGTRLQETQWSLSLAEQVSLSMKLATAYCLAERSESVPMMLDDALMCFDENKQQSAIKALWRASEKFQVIFFTRHRFTVEMFQSHLAGENDFSVIKMADSK